MLEQNTDRLMAVVAALVIGAILVALGPKIAPVFDSVIQNIQDAITGAGAGGGSF